MNITRHAKIRYCERIAQVPEAELKQYLAQNDERIDNIKSVEIKVEAGEVTECTVVMLAKAMLVEIEPEVWEKATGKADANGS